MPQVLWEVQVDPADLVSELRRKGKAASHLAPAFSVVAEDLVTAVIDRIDSRGDGEWPDNAPSTVARKGSDAPLIDRGLLRGSIRPESGDDWAMASTGIAYIVYHLDGGPIIPKRNPFELGDDVFEEAAAYIAAAAAEA